MAGYTDEMGQSLGLHMPSFAADPTHFLFDDGAPLAQPGIPERRGYSAIRAKGDAE